MTAAPRETAIALSLMKEALTMLDAPEAESAAQLLQHAIEAVARLDEPPPLTYLSTPDHSYE